MASTAADLHDASSAAYKKARRQHLKSTRNRDDHIEADWTPFRAAEKKYKAKFPPPDFSAVLDVALLDSSRSEECRLGGWSGIPDALDCYAVDLRNDSYISSGKAFVFPTIPGRSFMILLCLDAYIAHDCEGLVLLPNFVSTDEQRDLVRISLRDHARHPNETNLDTHYILPERGLWHTFLEGKRHGLEAQSVYPRALIPSDPSTHMPIEAGPRQLISNEAASKENLSKLTDTPMLPYAPSPNAKLMSPASLIPKLRWANIGWYYHWGTKQYDFSRGKIPVNPAYRGICTRAVQSVPWDEVFANDPATAEEWGDEPDWRTWHDSYGEYD